MMGYFREEDMEVRYVGDALGEVMRRRGRLNAEDRTEES